MSTTTQGIDTLSELKRRRVTGNYVRLRRGD